MVLEIKKKRKSKRKSSTLNLVYIHAATNILIKALMPNGNCISLTRLCFVALVLDTMLWWIQWPGFCAYLAVERLVQNVYSRFQETHTKENKHCGVLQ